MRKPRRHGKRFAAGRRRVGKSSRAVEQGGAGKRAPETAVGLAAMQAASETEVDGESRVNGVAGQRRVGKSSRAAERAGAGKRAPETTVGLAAMQAASETEVDGESGVRGVAMQVG
jgi:hypothetical protein